MGTTRRGMGEGEVPAALSPPLPGLRVSSACYRNVRVVRGGPVLTGRVLTVGSGSGGEQGEEAPPLRTRVEVEVNPKEVWGVFCDAGRTARHPLTLFFFPLETHR